MSPDRLRIGDAERDQAASELAEHYGDGRLTHEEYSERLDAIWSARTRADLTVLFEDLPPSRSAREQREREAARARRWRGVPILPIAIALIVLSAITHMPFWILIFVACFVLAKQRRHHRHTMRAH
jgi:hypothetical protein